MQFIVRVRATEIFGNCPRYVHKYPLVERSKFVPREARETRIPDRKRDVAKRAPQILPQSDRELLATDGQ
jgi:hypothetical protein